MKSLLKRFRMFLLLNFKYRIKTVGANFYMGRNNLINVPNMNVGNDVYIGNNCHFSVDSLTVNNYVMIASQVSIVGGDHRFDVVGVPCRDTGRANRLGVSIDKDCWIGHGVIILDGVRIQEGAIVAAGSVVTKDIEAYSVVAGVPARFIRKRFIDDKDILLHSSKINNIIK